MSTNQVKDYIDLSLLYGCTLWISYVMIVLLYPFMFNSTIPEFTSLEIHVSWLPITLLRTFRRTSSVRTRNVSFNKYETRLPIIFYFSETPFYVTTMWPLLSYRTTVVPLTNWSRVSVGGRRTFRRRRTVGGRKPSKLLVRVLELKQGHLFPCQVNLFSILFRRGKTKEHVR